MNADKPAAGANESLKGRLLTYIEDVSGRVEEHDDLVLRQDRIGEKPGILDVIRPKTMLAAERPDGADAITDRLMAKPGGFGKHEHRESRVGGLCGSAGKQPEHRHGN